MTPGSRKNRKVVARTQTSSTSLSFARQGRPVGRPGVRPVELSLRPFLLFPKEPFKIHSKTLRNTTPSAVGTHYATKFVHKKTYRDKLNCRPAPLFPSEDLKIHSKTLIQSRLPRTTLLGSGSEKMSLTVSASGRLFFFRKKFLKFIAKP